MSAGKYIYYLHPCKVLLFSKFSKVYFAMAPFIETEACHWCGPRGKTLGRWSLGKSSISRFIDQLAIWYYMENDGLECLNPFQRLF